MNDHTEWLLTQIDADEQQAHEHIAYWGKPTEGRPLAGDEYDCMSIGSARVLAECEAKRRLIDFAFQYASTIDNEWGCCHSAEEIRSGETDCSAISLWEVLSPLILPYASRPGCRPEWLPNGGDQ